MNTPIVNILPPLRQRVILCRNAFDRWIVINAGDPSLAWSGMQWVPVDRHGLPAGNTQIASLQTLQESLLYIEQFRFHLQQVGGA